MIRFEEEHRDIRDLVADFSDQELAPAARHLDETGGYPDAALAKLAEIGLLGVTAPDEHGGSGGDPLSAVIVVEELARNCVSTALVVATHVFDATRALVSLGTPEQKAAWLPGLASGEVIGTLALPEERAESDAGAVRTKADRGGGGWQLSGAKKHIISGRKAGFAAVVARTAGDAGTTSGLALFAVPGGARAGGVTITPVESPLGGRGTGLADWAFARTPLPENALLGSEDGFQAIAAVLETSRLGAAAVALGVGRGALTYALGYAGERRAFGRTIDRFGAVRSMIAEAATALESARLLVYRSATLLGQGKSLARESSMAKLAASRAAYLATKNAVQILGGNGYSREYPVERMYRDAESLELLGGSDSLHRMLVARALIGGSQ